MSTPEPTGPNISTTNVHYGKRIVFQRVSFNGGHSFVSHRLLVETDHGLVSFDVFADKPLELETLPDRIAS